jgi:hypothetical protein
MALGGTFGMGILLMLIASEAGTIYYNRCEKLTIKGDINKFNKAMIKSKFCQIKIEKKND